MTPRVSVLIDTYNHERYIDQAIVSAIEQDFPADDYEILVIDDGSTDRTPEIVRRFTPRVRLLQKLNGGQASAFNAAFPELRGEIISFLDGDDWFAPGKLSAVVSEMDRHPEAAAIGHGFYEFYDDDARTAIRVPPGPMFLSLSNTEVAANLFCGLLAWVITGALTVRRETLTRAMPIPEKLFFCADNPIAIASLAGGTRVLDQPLFYYRQHAANFCATAARDARRAKARYEMYKIIFAYLGPFLAKLEVPEGSRHAVLGQWTWVSREHLEKFGGSPLDTFRTEMASFRSQYKNSTLGSKMFMSAIGAAALLLPPRAFYRMQNWYGRRRNLAAVRERLVKSGD